MQKRPLLCTIGHNAPLPNSTTKRLFSQYFQTHLDRTVEMRNIATLITAFGLGRSVALPTDPAANHALNGIDRRGERAALHEGKVSIAEVLCDPSRQHS